MKMCTDHWQLMRNAIDVRGMSGLIAKDGETAFANEVAQLEAAKAGDPEPHKAAPFDPLMSMHWHFANDALRCGGLHMMTAKPDGSTRCPLCEFEINMPEFDAKKSIESVADQMAEYCRVEGLIPKVC